MVEEKVGRFLNTLHRQFLCV